MKDVAQETPPQVPLVTEVQSIWQSLAAARRNLLELIPEAALHQPIVSGKMGRPWHMVTDPAAIKRVLLERVEDYPKSEVTKNILRPAIGESLFVAEGAHWRWQRRAAAPVFTHRNIANLAPIMSAAADRSCARIARQTGRAANLYTEMMTAAFEVISDVTFSGDEQFDRAAVHRAVDTYIDQAARVSVLDILAMPAWVPRPGRLVGSKAMTQMKQMSDRVIDARREKNPGDIPDLLDLLLAGEDPKTKRAMNTAELRDNLLTFIVAGHETTALTLSWALYLCAFDPDVQDRLRDEARSLLQGRTATADDLPDLPYTRAVIDETLRLYPPAGFLSRTAQNDDTLCGTKIARGDTVTLPIYALHRSHLLWEDPHRFDPDRFIGKRPVDRYAYLPFGDGPRICIGASFAIQEAVIMLATIVSRVRLTRVPGKDPKPVMILTLRPEGGVWLNVEGVFNDATCRP